MKKIVVPAAAGLAVTLTGCASMGKAPGVATVASVGTRNDKVDAEVTKVDALVQDLRSTIDPLLQETLERLAAILTKAANEAQSARQ